VTVVRTWHVQSWRLSLSGAYAKDHRLGAKYTKQEQQQKQQQQELKQISKIGSASANMLDSFKVVSTSGVVLWSKKYAPVNPAVINALISDIFIEDRVQSGSDGKWYKKYSYTLKWRTANDLGLIFIVRLGYLTYPGFSWERTCLLMGNIGGLFLAFAPHLD